MIPMISWVLTVVLAVIAGTHVYWAFGGLWPAATETELVRTVIGNPVRAHMPPAWMTIVVALLLAMIAAWPLVLSRYAEALGGPLAAIAGSAILSVIFLARGVAGYLPAWRRLHPAEPFARLDRTRYAPLCLAIGACFLFVTTTKGPV